MADIFENPVEVEIKLDDNKVKKGDDVNVTAKDLTMHKVLIGAGWDTNAFDTDAVDFDLSCFLLDKHGMTRVDEDFVFYNQPETCEGGVRQNGDSRTGVGDGDDETMSIDLHKVPYDIFRILFTLTIYNGIEKEQTVSMVRNVYLRLVNEHNGDELLRYELDEDIRDSLDTGVIVGSLDREGPKWHFRPLGELVPGGLAEIARSKGLIIS